MQVLATIKLTGGVIGEPQSSQEINKQTIDITLGEMKLSKGQIENIPTRIIWKEGSVKKLWGATHAEIAVTDGTPISGRILRNTTWTLEPIDLEDESGVIFHIK